MPKSAKPVHPVSVRLPEDVYQQIVEWAEQSQRSISGEIVFLLKVAIHKFRKDEQEKP